MTLHFDFLFSKKSKCKVMSILSHTPSPGSFDLFKELFICWRFINNDIKDTIAPSLIAFGTAWFYYDSNFIQLPIRLSCSLLYAVLYILTFCMLNQVNSVEEDTINKPYRPLPSKMLTRQGTWIRIVIYSALFLMLAALLGIFWISVGWQIVTYFLNIWGGSNHWITKNWVGMSIGTFLLLGAQWHIAAPDSTPGRGEDFSVIFYWIFISLWAGFSLPLQDFRDVKGDGEMKRKTLPLSLGDQLGRLIMVISYSTFLPSLFLAAMLSIRTFQELMASPIGLIILIGQTLVHWLIAYRLWCFRQPKEDDRTYHLYVYLFCILLPTICYL